MRAPPLLVRHSTALVCLTALGLAIALAGCDSGGSASSDLPTPAIDEVAPTEGSVGTELSITGQQFDDGASVRIGETDASTVEVASSSQLYADVPEGIPYNTALPVIVANAGSKTDTVKAAFTAIEPELEFVNSATKPSGQIGSTVILDGKAFGDTQGPNSTVFFTDGNGGSVAASIASDDDWTDTFIVTTVPSGAADGPVWVETSVGASDSLTFNVTDGANFSPSSITWTSTAALPTAVSGHVASYVPVATSTGDPKRFLHVTGGRDAQGNGLTQALAGTIGQQGEVTQWTQTQSLPSARSFHASVAATPFNSRVKGNGYLYAIGGTNDAGDPVATVSKADIQDDGTLGAWSDETMLPQPLHSAGAALFRSAIYVVGGATTGDAPVATVYKAEIDTSGRLGMWEAQDQLPAKRAYHGLVSFGGRLYAVGGDSASVAPDAGSNGSALVDVTYTPINLRSGDTEGWTNNANALGKARSKHSTLASGGFLFVSSGLYSAASQGSSENVYAPINSDGTVGEFNGATGSNTLQSEGGTNLFNQGSISYVDGSGEAHVIIIGGDDVNSPGNKQTDVFYY